MSEPVDTSAEAVENLARFHALSSKLYDAEEESGIRACAVMTNRLLRALAAERDRMRDALQKIAGISNECTWTPKLRPLAAELQGIIRAALSQPPVKDKPDA
jgi:hypothetical protein